MDIQDFLKNRNKYQHKREQRNYYQGNFQKPGPYTYKDGYEKFDLLAFLNSIRRNKKLRGIILIVLIVILAVIIGLIAVLFPMIMNLFNYISQNGISGLADMAMDFLNRLWDGAK
jgi:hypothetical protein